MSSTSCNTPSLSNEEDSIMIDSHELLKIADEDVVKVEKYRRPLYNALMYMLASLGAHHMGCAVTLRSGAKYMIHKFTLSGENEGEALVCVAAWKHIDTSIWKKIDEKKVSKSKVKNYVAACGKWYSLGKDDCRHAAERMFALQ